MALLGPSYSRRRSSSALAASLSATAILTPSPPTTDNIIPEREFYADLQRFPFERTQHYSPFLLNVSLAVGCRYLEPTEDYPPEICGLIGDPDTRGDVFITWARYLLDQ